MNKMKKVLVIGHFWPYHRGGSKRMLGLAKYLPDFGWEPVVLSFPLPFDVKLKYRVVEVTYRDWLKVWTKRFGFTPEGSVKKQVAGKLGIKSKKSLKS